MGGGEKQGCKRRDSEDALTTNNLSFDGDRLLLPLGPQFKQLDFVLNSPLQPQLIRYCSCSTDKLSHIWLGSPVGLVLVRIILPLLHLALLP